MRDSYAVAASSAVGASAALGVYADVGSYAATPWDVLPELGFPWFVLAVAWGRMAIRSATGALAGFAGIVAGLVSWTLFKAWAYGYDSVRWFLQEDVVGWIVLAALVGAVGGVAGVLQRRGRTTWSAEVGFGAMPAVALAEGLVLLAAAHRHPVELGATVGWAELALGAALMVLLAPDRRVGRFLGAAAVVLVPAVLAGAGWWVVSA